MSADPANTKPNLIVTIVVSPPSTLLAHDKARKQRKKNFNASPYQIKRYVKRAKKDDQDARSSSSSPSPPSSPANALNADIEARPSAPLNTTSYLIHHGGDFRSEDLAELNQSEGFDQYGSMETVLAM